MEVSLLFPGFTIANFGKVAYVKTNKGYAELPTGKIFHQRGKTSTLLFGNKLSSKEPACIFKPLPSSSLNYAIQFDARNVKSIKAGKLSGLGKVPILLRQK